MAYPIKVFAGADVWLTRHADPIVRELFGTDVLPTPYLATVPAAVVLANLMAVNPDRVIELEAQPIVYATAFDDAALRYWASLSDAARERWTRLSIASELSAPQLAYSNLAGANAAQPAPSYCPSRYWPAPSAQQDGSHE